ncbi:MAG: LamG domain-containing protein, partial [Nanoarchaeota archaeon]
MIIDDGSLSGWSELTLSFWLRRHNVEDYGFPVRKYNTDYTGYNYYLRVGPSYVQGWIYNDLDEGTRAVNFDISEIVDNTDWHRYDMIYDGSYIRVYIDGEEIASESFSETINSANSPIFIDFEGEMDDLKIYDQALDLSNIPTCPSGVQRDCLNQLGVCLGSKELCVNNEWAGCTTETFETNSEDYEEIEITCNDGLDNDCDGLTDDEDLNCQCLPFDVDGDNWFTTLECNNGYEILDCNDENENVNPRTLEICDDDTDNDCDGLADCEDNDCASQCGLLTEDLTVLRNSEDSNGVKLLFNDKSGADEYAILRNDKLGWKGTIELLQDIQDGDTIIHVESTDGLLPGDEVHTSNEQYDYYIKEVIDDTSFELTHPVIGTWATPQNHISLSAAWVRDYSEYEEIARVDNLQYNDTGLELDKDYYYVIGYVDNSEIVSYSNPVGIKFDGVNVLYDAVLPSNGGYSWKVWQRYSDTPELIDGNKDTNSMRIQYNNALLKPLLLDAGADFTAGFHKFELNDLVNIKEIEISQNLAENRIHAKNIEMKFDDGSTLSFDLEEDTLIERIEDGDYMTYKIPINKDSSSVSIYVNDINNINQFYIEWSEVNIYTEDLIKNPVTSATLVDSVDITIDFSQNDGNTPTIFGTDELYNNVQGREEGYMLRSWPYTKEIFDLYRIQLSDFWPNAYAYDSIYLGDLSTSITSDDLVLELDNVPVSLEIDDDLPSGANIKIGDELMRFSFGSGNTVTLSSRGYDATFASSHDAGSPVYLYKNVRQLMRLQEVLPEFEVIKYPGAYVSGILEISNEHDPAEPDYVALDDSLRTGILNLIVDEGEYLVGDVIRNGREKFLVLAVDDSNPNA